MNVGTPGTYNASGTLRAAQVMADNGGTVDIAYVAPSVGGPPTKVDWTRATVSVDASYPPANGKFAVLP